MWSDKTVCSPHDPAYSRPRVATREYRDDSGHLVAYGRRREESSDSGPRGARTSVFSHQERYEPIFVVADALIAYLVATYDATVEDSVEYASAFDVMEHLQEPSFTRVVRIQPSGAEQAPVVIGFHDHPGSLRVVAGCFSEFDMWFCGCDACDEPWEGVADALEHVILTVVTRGLSERVDPHRRGSARYWLDSSQRRQLTGAIPKRGMSPAVLARATEASRRLGDGMWSPWTPRATAP